MDWVLLPTERAEKSLADWLVETADDLDGRLEAGLGPLAQACRGVAAIHAAGLVHLDLKPATVLLVRDTVGERAAARQGRAGPLWVVKVADFGLTRGLDRLVETRPELLADGVGNPAYMAPEQVLAARWRDVTALADVYALGMVLYELLDGDLPYSGTGRAIRDKKVNPAVRVSRPRGPERLALLALRCLEREPGARPGSAAELERLLAEDPEAEWEYAARAGTGTRYWWGHDFDAQHVWCSDNSGGSTQPVGRKPANPWGLLDMLGDVWEWCADPWHGSYQGAPAEAVVWAGDGCCRAVRGGSWGDDSGSLRVSFRGSGTRVGRYDYLGLRSARGV